MKVNITIRSSTLFFFKYQKENKIKTVIYQAQAIKYEIRINIELNKALSKTLE